MAEALKRVWLPQGKQRGFIDSAIKKCGRLDSLAKTLGVSPRTIRDWRREKFLMSSRSANILRKKCGLELPQGAKLRNEFWYVTKGARRGGLASYKKQGGQIGDPKIRLQKWREWWEKEGESVMKNHPIFQLFPFKQAKASQELAEFFGVMMGDGGISKNQICITLHYIDDLEYGRYVVKLVKRLFSVSPSIYHSAKNSVNNIVVSRTGLVRYLHSLGLPIGNKVKQNFDIPRWIKANREFKVACLRGLIDTDGLVFTHSYKVNGKLYCYKKLSFTSLSWPLAQSVHRILKESGFRPRFSQGKDVRLDSIDDMRLYFKIIGSRNPKHLKRYYN